MTTRSMITVTLALLVSGSHSQVATWGQCGGTGWSGSTSCTSGTTCSSVNPYYFQCVPGTSTKPANPAPTGTTLITSKAASSTSTVSAPVNTGCAGSCMAASSRPRIIVDTDFPPLNSVPGGENGPGNMKSDLDDLQTMVRFLVYANEFDIEGLIASSATFANYADKKNILSILDLYEKVQPNLALHASGFPSAATLRSVTKQGRSGTWGASANDILGAGKDSEASDHIISVVDKADSRPVWFVEGGGPAALGQALWKVKNTRTPAQVDAFVAKLRVYLIIEQDGTAKWMKDNFPNLFVITSNCYFGMNTGSYNGAWLKDSVTTNHGPLGAAYPLAHWTYNDQGIFEGDTPMFLHVLNGIRGLSDPGSPDMGGWGGRFQNVGGNKWECASEGNSGVSRWVNAFNSDFAARMDWNVKPYGQANHNPVVTLNGDGSRNVVTVNAAVGSTVSLSAAGTTDPDGNALSYKWYQYPVTAGVSISGGSSASASFKVPDAKGSKIYIVLEVTDNGTPSLTSYRRLVVKVQ